MSWWAQGISAAATLYSASQQSKGSGGDSLNVETKSYNELEKGLNFGSSGSFQQNNRNIEGMDTSMVKRDDFSIGQNSQTQFNLGNALLQPQFQKSRTQVSNSLASRGLGQTSSFANAMADISGQESMAQSSLLSNIMKAEQQDQLSRNQMGSQMELGGLNSRDKRSQSRYNLEGQRLAAEAKMNAAKMSSDSSKSSGAASAIGSVASAYASKPTKT